MAETMDIAYNYCGEITMSQLAANTKYNIPVKKRDPFYSHVENLIFNIPFPRSWREEGIAEPNIASKEIAKEVCFYLYKEYDLIPIKIVPNKEEGISIFYKSYNNNRSLIVETYNTAETAALVNDDARKNVIVSEDIKDFSFTRTVNLLYG
ncbi:MAG: hypothetical protein QME81_04860 [bacterium]|nr:hypothetical protein [bacterium]